MPLFDKSPPPPGRPIWDRIAYPLCAILIWAAVIYEIVG